MLSSSAQGLDALDKGKFMAEINHFILKKNSQGFGETVTTYPSYAASKETSLKPLVQHYTRCLSHPKMSVLLD